MGSLAASGGYYISAPCRWIVANELTITGSIGVIMHGYNYRGLMDKVGLKREVFKSGKFKDMMSPDRSDAEIPAEERAMVQGLIDETYEKFKGIVAEGRQHAHELNKKDGHELASNWADFADGRILSGKQALGLGLVDELGDYDDALNRTIKLAGIEDDSANVVEYQPKHDFSEFLRRFSKSDARGLKVDLGMEFPKLHAGYMYFLSPTFLH
jgi:protease-4